MICVERFLRWHKIIMQKDSLPMDGEHLIQLQRLFVEVKREFFRGIKRCQILIFFVESGMETPI